MALTSFPVQFTPNFTAIGAAMDDAARKYPEKNPEKLPVSSDFSQLCCFIKKPTVHCCSESIKIGHMPTRTFRHFCVTGRRFVDITGVLCVCVLAQVVLYTRC